MVRVDEHPRKASSLAAEAVQSATLALERIDDIERRDGLALGVLGVGDSVTDDTLQEGLKDTTSLFVDHYAATTLACA